MKKIKIATMIDAMFMGKGVYAQKGIKFTVKYNVESEKFEVHAKANFTKYFF